MPRLPLASTDDLRDELAEISVAIERCHRMTPPSADAAARRDERLERLRVWDRDLREQLAELTQPPRVLARSVSLDPSEGYSLSDPKRNGPGGRW